MKRLALVGVTVLAVGLTTWTVVADGQDVALQVDAVKSASRCDERTLAGTYGVTLSGLRPGAAGALEQFVGLSMQTYDGRGNFTQTDNTHGPSGARSDQAGWGTYTVNPDCSGTKTLWLDGMPFPIENRIVILEKGDEIRIVVMSPPPIVVAGQGRRVF
jgi:hypothetical protein